MQRDKDTFMKIIKPKLKQIIKEELLNVLKETRFLALSSKANPVRSLAGSVDSDGDGSLSADELRALADELGQDELGPDEIASYTCPQLKEVMRQKQEAGADPEEIMQLKQLMRKKGCWGI